MMNSLLALAAEVGVPAGMGLGGAMMGAWIYKKLSSHGERIAILETHLPHIRETLEEIKADVTEIKAKLP